MKHRRAKSIPVLLLAPFFTGLVLFWLIPIAKGFHLSLQSDTLFDEPVFIGFAHYGEIMRDGRYWHALRNTAVYATMTISLVTVFSLALAHLLRRAYARMRGTVIFCLMLPGLTPPAVLAFLYLLVFNGPHGLLNTLLAAPFGLPMVDWIRDPRVIKFSLVLLALWRWSGFTTLILLSGMEGIPKTYYDLARAEGARAWGVFRHVTLPLLSHVLAFTAVFLLLDAFVLFEGAYILLGGSGGSLDAGLLLVAYTYQTAFSLGRFGTAAAMGFSMVPLLMLAVWMLLLRGRGRAERSRASVARAEGIAGDGALPGSVGAAHG